MQFFFCPRRINLQKNYRIFLYKQKILSYCVLTLNKRKWNIYVTILFFFFFFFLNKKEGNILKFYFTFTVGEEGKESKG